MSARHRASGGEGEEATSQVASPGQLAPPQDTSVPDTPGTTSAASGPQEEVRLVVKADVQGSVEAVCQLVQQLSSPSVNIKVGEGGQGSLACEHRQGRWWGMEDA